MATFTFGGQCANHGRIATDSGHTQGGYSKRMTVHRHFAIKVRNTVDIWVITSVSFLKALVYNANAI